MDKRTELNKALKEAMKEKDQVAMSTIRLVIAALKDRDIMARSNGQADGISDQEILGLLQSMIKQRRESSDTYRKAGRDDLVEREEEEIKILRSFLPAQLDDNEVRQAVDDLIAEMQVTDIREMGKVMGALKSRYAGQVDMGKASGIVKERLAS